MKNGSGGNPENIGFHRMIPPLPYFLARD